MGEIREIIEKLDEIMSKIEERKMERRVKAGAKILHNIGKQYGWWKTIAPSWTYPNPDDPIGTDEFEDIVWEILVETDKIL